MKKKAKDDFTVSELNILRLLWTEKRSLSCAEMLELLPELNLFSTSIYAILEGMISKGVLMVDGKIRSGKRYARTYKPTISQEDFATSQMFKLTSNIPKTERLVGIFASMVNHEGLDTETLSKLEEFLQQKRKELDL